MTESGSSEVGRDPSGRTPPSRLTARAEPIGARGRRSRIDPADRALVEERIGRLNTDALVTRRGYLRILGVLSGGLAAGNLAVAAGVFERRTDGAHRELLITDDVDAMPVGGEVRFTYPTDNDPAVLLRLEEELFVAYSTVCTHLACEVLWVRDERDLFCPCHDGHFDPSNGAPTAGPPQRPLPEIRLARRGNSIVALGEGRIRQEGG